MVCSTSSNMYNEAEVCGVGDDSFVSHGPSQAHPRDHKQPPSSQRTERSSRSLSAVQQSAVKAGQFRAADPVEKLIEIIGEELMCGKEEALESASTMAEIYENDVERLRARLVGIMNQTKSRKLNSDVTTFALSLLGTEQYTRFVLDVENLRKEGT